MPDDDIAKRARSNVTAQRLGRDAELGGGLPCSQQSTRHRQARLVLVTLRQGRLVGGKTAPPLQERRLAVLVLQRNQLHPVPWYVERGHGGALLSAPRDLA